MYILLMKLFTIILAFLRSNFFQAIFVERLKPLYWQIDKTGVYQIEDIRKLTMG